MTLRRFALHGASTSLVIEQAGGDVPLWRYWGPRLGEGFDPGPALQETRPTPSFSLDETVAFSVFPCFGLGWFGQSALLAHRGGRDFAHGFTSAQVDWVVPGKALAITLDDAVAKLRVVLAIALAGDVLTVSSSLTNLGDAPLTVDWLAAAALPLPASAAHVESFSGRHNAEFQPQCDALGKAIWRKENRRGLTSHDAFPGAVVDAGGWLYGAHLAWSGNSAQSIEWLDDGRYQWQWGCWLAPGEVILGAGETLESPALLASCAADANTLAQQFHSAMRARLDWPGGKMRPRPVHLNSWEGYYFDHDLPSLIRLADAAAQVGIERFVLDDGWFHRRNDDRAGLGDWWVDAAKYPDGLGPLADHVTGLGMEFGLWIEPEMINPDSDLFRAHPDWALQTAGRPLQTARNQLLLDLTQQAVQDYLLEKIGSVIDALPLSYLKWDHNRDLVGAGNRASYRAQTDAAYRLFAAFRARWPQIEIEACAGGGGRIDAGILRHTHRFWTSDCIDAVSRATMQPGFLRFMPPEVMGAHIGTAPAHSTGRSQSLDFRAAIACQGHLGVELDLVQMPAEERQRLAAWISFYKRWRHLLHGQQVWTGEEADGLRWHAAGSAQEWLLFVYRMTPASQRHMGSIKLPFVQHDRLYDLAITGPDGDAQHGTQSGDWLAQAGLATMPGHAEQAVIFHGSANLKSH